LIGLWSRRLNSKDRIIYEILEYIVVVDITSAAGHYSD
jgi:toxin YoeB